MSAVRQTDLLIVGAGPFGLAVAAQAQRLGIDHLVAGQPMSFWKRHMPAGMYLRSNSDWHLDPANEHTIDRFLATQNLTRAEVEPLSLDFYLSYVDWFQRQLSLDPMPFEVRALQHAAGEFRAELDNGDTIAAKAVVLAIGFQPFAHVPPDMAALLPAGRFAHTCDLVDLRALDGRRVLILGGRQSAFEWAALLADAGAASVDVVHRHDSPRFAEADWSWVPSLVSRFEDEPGWFRRLPQDERDAIGQRMWGEGRLKVEPWLKSRLPPDRVTIRPRTQVHGASVRAEGTVEVFLDTGASLIVDQIIFATGYKPDVGRVPLLSRGNLLQTLDVRNGCPTLDDNLQTSIPRLFVTSFLATADFGNFFAFTVAARTSARLIVRAIAAGRGTEVPRYIV